MDYSVVWISIHYIHVILMFYIKIQMENGVSSGFSSYMQQTHSEPKSTLIHSLFNLGNAMR